MHQRIASVTVLAALLLGGTTGARAATTLEVMTCDLEGTGELSPGVTFAPQDFGVTIDLDVTCESDDPTFDSGHVTGSGSGFGGCGFSSLSGTAVIDWTEGEGSDMDWTAVGGGRTLHVDGEFVGGPFEGKHFRTVGVIGADDPTQCAGSGITHVTFSEVGVIA